MKKSKPNPPWDDGRTIVNMNVPGMPWYNKRKYRDDVSAVSDNKKNKIIPEPLARNEIMDTILGGTFAALLVGLILCAGIVLFVFLCVSFL